MKLGEDEEVYGMISEFEGKSKKELQNIKTTLKVDDKAKKKRL